MGVERPQPVINDQSRNLGFTNEIGFGDSVRLLKNIVGLWLLQESRRHWTKAGRKLEFAELEKLAAAAPPFVSLINPDDPRFLSPDDMPGKIADFCRETGQPVPADIGACVRCIYESLALFYRVMLRRTERLIGRKIERLHIVGGGSKDATLNQFTANADEDSRARRPDRMRRAGQHPGAGHRARPCRIARGGARSRAEFVRAAKPSPRRTPRNGTRRPRGLKSC